MQAEGNIEFRPRTIIPEKTTLSQRFSYSPHPLSMYTNHGIGMNVPSGDNWILPKDHQPRQMGLPSTPYIYKHEKTKYIQEPSQSRASTWLRIRYVQYVVYQFSRRTSGVLLFLQGEPDTWYFCNDFI
jgi:hypothetical protein